MNIMSEQVEQAAEKVGLKRMHSCCNVPHKFCSSDIWQGDLRAFSAAIARAALAQQPSDAEDALYDPVVWARRLGFVQRENGFALANGWYLQHDKLHALYAHVERVYAENKALRTAAIAQQPSAQQEPIGTVTTSDPYDIWIDWHKMPAPGTKLYAAPINQSLTTPAQIEAEPVPTVIKTAPERIWLQVSDEDFDNEEPFKANAETTWCEDSVMACEVPYVRADLTAPRSVAPAGYVLVPIEPSIEWAKSVCMERAKIVGKNAQHWSWFKPDLLAFLQAIAAAPKQESEAK